MKYTIKTAVGLDNNPLAKKVRTAVFIEEQGFYDEFDDIDKTAVQTVMFADGEPIATGRLYEDERGYHIGRIAVMKDYRGHDLGRVLMTALEDEAWKMSADKISLSAQVRAEGFYKKLGYESLGDLHYDEGCPHVTMVKMRQKSVEKISQ